MTTSESRLVITVDSRSAEQRARDTARALGELEKHGLGAQAGVTEVNRALKETEGAAGAAQASVKRLLAGALAGLSAMKVIDTADEWGQLAARMRMATQSADEYEKAQERMLRSANATYRSISETRESFIQLSPVLRQMGLSLEQSMDAIDAFSGLLVVNAASGDRAQAAMRALSISLQKGKIDADSWITIYSTLDSVVDVIAANTGMAADEIRRLGAEGKLSVDTFARALVGQVGSINEQVESMPTTVRDSMQKVVNEFTEYVGRANEARGVTAGLADGIAFLGENLTGVLNTAVVAGGVAMAAYTARLIGAATAAGAGAIASREAALAAAANTQAELAAAQAQSAQTAATLAQARAMQGLTGTRAQLVAATAAHEAAERRVAAAQAASVTANAAVVGLGSRLLGVLGGPVGLVTTIGLTAAGFYAMDGASKRASVSLDDLTGSADKAVAKFKELGKLQQEVALAEMAKAQATAVREAAVALSAFVSEIEPTTEQGGRAVAQMRASMTAQVRQLTADTSLSANEMEQRLAEMIDTWVQLGWISEENAGKLRASGLSMTTVAGLASQLSQNMRELGAAGQVAAGGVAALNDNLVKTDEAGKKYLENLTDRSLIAGLTTQRAQLDALVKAGKLVFAEDDLERARKAADRIDRFAKSAGGAKSALDKLNLSSFGNALALQSAQIESALKELDIVWNRGDMGADRYFARRIAMAEAAGAAQEKALQQEIAALNTLSTRGKAGQQVREKLADAETKLAVARAKSSSEIAGLRAEEEAYFRGPSLENIKTLTEQSFALRDQNLALEEQVKFFGLAGSEIEKLRVARLNEQIAQQNAALATAIANGATETEIERIRDLIAALYNLRNAREVSAGLQGRQEALQKEKERIEASVQSWGKGIDKIGELFVEGFSASLDRNGDAFKAFTDNAAKALKNSVATALYEATVKPVVIRFVAQMAGVLGGSGVQEGILKQAGLGGTGGGFGGLGSLLTNFGGGVTESLYKVGQSLSGMGGPLESLGNALFDNAKSIGQVADFAGDVIGYGKAIYDLTKGNYGSAAGTAIGTYFGGPIGAAIGSQIGGLIDGAFKGETRMGGGYTVGADGRYFRSGGPSGGDPNEAQTAATVQGVLDGVRQMATQYGGNAAGLNLAAGWELSPDKGNSFVFSDWARSGEELSWERGLRSLSGVKDGETVAAEFATELNRALLRGVEMAGIEQAYADIIRAANIDTLDAAGVQQVLASLAALQQFATALASLPFVPAAAATSGFAKALADAAGGAENAANLLAGYYSNYYTEAERTAHLTEQLTGRFAELGLSLPQTRDEMRGLVEANLALGEAGAKTAAELLGMQESLATILAAQEQAAQAILQERLGLEGQLLQLMGDTAELRRRELERLDPSNRALQERIWALQAEQEAATAVATAIEAATRAAEDMVDATWQLAVSAVNDAMSAVTKVVQAERDAIQTAHNTAMSGYQTQLQAAQRAVSELSSVSNALTGALRSMRLESDAFEQMRRVEAQAQISAALAIARAGGSLRNLDLGDALSVLTQSNTSMFASFEDYALDWARTANEVGALQEIAGKQLSSEERAVTALERQIEIAGRQHEAEMQRLQDIADQAQAQVDAALGIDTSVMTVQQAVMALAQSIGKLGSTPRPPAETPQTSGSVVDGWYRNILGRPADSGGAAYWESEIRRIGAAKALEDFLYSARGVGELASFAVGTNYVPNDMVAQIHQGERIIPAADNARLMEMVQQGSNREEMRALRAEIVELRRVVAAGNADNRRLVDMFDNVSAGGNVLLTEPAMAVGQPT